jgi:hypothetical protein
MGEPLTQTNITKFHMDYYNKEKNNFCSCCDFDDDELGLFIPMIQKYILLDGNNQKGVTYNKISFDPQTIIIDL